MRVATRYTGGRLVKRSEALLGSNLARDSQATAGEHRPALPKTWQGRLFFPRFFCRLMPQKTRLRHAVALVRFTHRFW